MAHTAKSKARELAKREPTHMLWLVSPNALLPLS